MLRGGLECGFREEYDGIVRFFELLLYFDDLYEERDTLAGHQECSSDCAHTTCSSANYKSIITIQKTISIN